MLPISASLQKLWKSKRCSINLWRNSSASKPQRRKRWVKGTDNYQANQNVFYTVKQVQQQSGGESLPDFSVPVLPRTAQEWKLGADLILYRFLGYSLVQRSLYGPEEYGRGIFLLRRMAGSIKGYMAATESLNGRRAMEVIWWASTETSTLICSLANVIAQE